MRASCDALLACGTVANSDDEVLTRCSTPSVRQKRVRMPPIPNLHVAELLIKLRDPAPADMVQRLCPPRTAALRAQSQTDVPFDGRSPSTWYHPICHPASPGAPSTLSPLCSSPRCANREPQQFPDDSPTKPGLQLRQFREA